MLDCIWILWLGCSLVSFCCGIEKLMNNWLSVVSDVILLFGFRYCFRLICWMLIWLVNGVVMCFCMSWVLSWCIVVIVWLYLVWCCCSILCDLVLFGISLCEWVSWRWVNCVLVVVVV